MKLAFELITGLTLHFAPHHKLALYLKKGELLLEETWGEDRFDYNGMVLPDQPVCATGRKVLHTYEPGLAVFQGVPCRPAEIPPEPGKAPADLLQDLSLWLDNNAVMSQGELQTYYRLKAYVDGRAFPLPLLSPLMKVSWEGQGLFRIGLAGLARPLGLADEQPAQDCRDKTGGEDPESDAQQGRL
jgi:hypothetical protein